MSFVSVTGAWLCSLTNAIENKFLTLEKRFSLINYNGFFYIQRNNLLFIKFNIPVLI